jgi:hypothetical protein
MEFYELNRLYDENLDYWPIMRTLDRYMYIFMPFLITLGCAVSIISIMVLTRPYFDNTSTSKRFLLSQSIFNLLFQCISALIFVVNYYENVRMLKESAAQIFKLNDFKQVYLSLRSLINLAYNITLYCSIWLFVVSALDYCLISIVKFHFNLNFNRIYKKLFYKQQARVFYNQKQLKERLKHRTIVRKSPLGSPQNSYPPTSILSNQLYQYTTTTAAPPITRTQHSTTNSSSSSYSYNPNNGTVEEIMIETDLLDEIDHPEAIIIDDEKDDAFMEELNVYDLENLFDGNKKLKNKRKSMKKLKQAARQAKLDEDERIIFCKPSQISYSIFFIIFFAVLLVYPQLIAFEIKQNVISISPSEMPVPITTPNPQMSTNLNMDFNRMYENVYFIEDDQSSYNGVDGGFSDEHRSGGNDFMYKLSLVRAVHKALGLSIRFNLSTHRNQQILNRMKFTHSKFFTLREYFRLATNQYDFCNMIKNVPIPSEQKNSLIIKKPKITLLKSKKKSTNKSYKTTTTTTTTTEKFGVKIDVVNISLICIKNDLYQSLAYSTLYFWLEHTMVISVPICIVLVVLASLVYIFLHLAKMIQYQDKLKSKHRKLLDQQKNYEKMYTKAKLNHRHNQNHNDKILCQESSTQELILNNEKIIRRKQIETQNLNLLFIIDLTLYMFASLPYTLMRLVLDLFVKDRFKVDMDFYMLYMICFSMFHLHLIAKFFLMCGFNIKFRACLARAFNLKPSVCCLSDDMQSYFDDYDDNDGLVQNLRYKFQSFKNKILKNERDKKSIFDNYGNPLNNFNHKINNFDDDDFFTKSKEFKTSFHQLMCPADPDREEEAEPTPTNYIFSKSFNKENFDFEFENFKSIQNNDSNYLSTSVDQKNVEVLFANRSTKTKKARIMKQKYTNELKRTSSFYNHV